MIIKIKKTRNINIKINTDNWTIEKNYPYKKISKIEIPFFDIHYVGDLKKLIADINGIPRKVVFFANSGEILEKDMILFHNIQVWLFYKPIKCIKHKVICC